MENESRKKQKLENERIIFFEKINNSQILKGEIPINDNLKSNVKSYRRNYIKYSHRELIKE